MTRTVTDKGSIGLRVDTELADWLKEKAAAKNCNVSDLVREAIIVFKQLEDLPKDSKYSAMLNVKSSKAAYMTYRLLEKFIQHALPNDGNKIIVEATTTAKKEIDAWKIETNEKYLEYEHE